MYYSMTQVVGYCDWFAPGAKIVVLYVFVCFIKKFYLEKRNSFHVNQSPDDLLVIRPVLTVAEGAPEKHILALSNP